MHALIFDKSLHCAVLFTIFGFCTVCQICQRHCVTCHFWSNILRKWLLAGVSKFVSYLDIAISLWKSDFEWSSSWNECLIKEYRSKSTFCHCVTFWKLFRFSHLTTTDPISSAYILIFSAPYSYLTKKKVQNLPLFASSYSYKRLEKVTSLIVTQWRSCFFTQKHPNVAMWNPSSPFCALLWRYLYKGRQNICL